MQTYLASNLQNLAVSKRDTLGGCLKPRRKRGLAWCVAWIAISGHLFSGICPGADLTAPIPEVGTVARLSLEDGAKGLPVKVQGTVTWSDADRGLLFIQDENYGVAVRSQNNSTNAEFQLDLGQVVEVEGVTRRGRVQCGIQASKVRVLRSAELPRAINLWEGDIFNAASEARYARVKGWVAGVSRVGGRLSLQVLVAQGRAVEFMLKEGDTPAAREWPCSFVEGIGAFSLVSSTSGQVQGARLYVHDASSIRVIKTLPVSPINELSSLAAGKGEPIRIRGTVVHHALGDYLIARDNTGSLRVPFRALTYFNPGSQVEVFALAVKSRPELVLTNSSVRLVLSDTGTDEPAAVILTPSSANPKLPTLTKIAQVRELSAQEASRGYPIAATGVITHSDPSAYLQFVQDDTAGVYLDLNKLEDDVKLAAGQRVEVEGFSGPGNYAPVILARKLHILGEGSFPKPASASFQKLMTGAFDSQWTTLRGVVRNHWTNNGSSTLWLHTGDGLIKVSVAEKEAGPTLTNLVDSTMEVMGVCGTRFDDRRQLQSAEIHAPGWEHIVVTEAPAADPFTLEAKPISELFQFRVAGAETHRARVVGVVVLRQRDGSFYLQDGGGGIEVQPQDTSASVELGATVEVVGFPQMVEKLPTIQVAIFRNLQNRAPVEVPTLKAEAQLDQALHGTLVKFEAQVLRHFSHASQEWLNVQFGQRVVEVNLEKSSAKDELGQIEPGSIVRCTGIYLAQFDQGGQFQSFRTLLRSKADAVVLTQPAGWWTTRRMLWALGASAAALLLALGWVRSLRNQVQERIRELAYERDLLKVLLESYPDAIYFKDLESRFVRLSKSKVERALALARRRHSESCRTSGTYLPMPGHLRSFEAFNEYITGKTDFDFFEKERAQEAFDDEQNIVKTGQPLLGKLEQAVLPDGQVYWALSTKMPWRDPQGKIIGTLGISKDITSIKEAEAKLGNLHKQLLETSRQAGMAEVATSVLHNVGNVLNSVNVTTNLLQEKLQKSKLPSLTKVVDLIHEHEADLGDFITKDLRGRTLPHYLEQLNEQLIGEQQILRQEIECLSRNMDHIKSIVSMQQSYAKVSGVTERAQASELVEDALRFNAGALDRHRIDIQRDFASNVPELTVDRHKVLQILVNLIRNAKYACDESGRTDKLLTVSVRNGDGRVRISVSDNGVGIAPENLTRIFNLGFTTRKEGHGFGLHSGALAARELNGVLRVNSDGPGKGSTFTLELPITQPYPHEHRGAKQN